MSTGIIHNPTNTQKLDAYNNLWHKLYLTVTTFLETHTQQDLNDAWDEQNHLGKWARSENMTTLVYKKKCRGCDNVVTVVPYNRGTRGIIGLHIPCLQYTTCRNRATTASEGACERG